MEAKREGFPKGGHEQCLGLLRNHVMSLRNLGFGDKDWPERGVSLREEEARLEGHDRSGWESLMRKRRQETQET